MFLKVITHQFVGSSAGVTKLLSNSHPAVHNLKKLFATRLGVTVHTYIVPLHATMIMLPVPLDIGPFADITPVRSRLKL